MYAKLIELIYACEKANELINNPALRGDTRVPASFKGGRGVAHIEAPRGTLIHDYEIDEKGIVRAANMIIATQQNTAAINKSLKQAANNLLKAGSDEAMLNSPRICRALLRPLSGLFNPCDRPDGPGHRTAARRTNHPHPEEEMTDAGNDH